MNNLFTRIVLLAACISIHSCKTDETEPLELSTTNVYSITTTDARVGGIISSGNATSFGVCWSTHANSTIADHKTDDGSGSGAFESYLTNLDPHTIYFVRSYATNSGGTMYGNELSFTTLGQAPSVVASSVIRVARTSAILAGTINSNSVATLVTFEYGLDTSYGAVVPAVQNPVNGSNEVVTAEITALQEYSSYHFRVRAENDVGVTYGEDVTFPLSGTKSSVTDIEGYTYEAIVIGTQTWMTENLRTVHLNDGTAIPYVDDGLTWATLTTQAYTFLNFDAVNKELYGVLYNWYTVDTHKLCPVGWHVPSREEWMKLNTDSFLGGQAGGKMKETGSDYWDLPNEGADNSSGFSGRGGGIMLAGGSSYGLREIGVWWTSTLLPGALIHGCNSSLSKDHDKLVHDSNFREVGSSVRCIKD